MVEGGNMEKMDSRFRGNDKVVERKLKTYLA
jgi:hypothetical protein